MSYIIYKKSLYVKDTIMLTRITFTRTTLRERRNKDITYPLIRDNMSGSTL